MLIHPWDAPRDEAEWQRWLATHDFGQLAVNGLPGEPPHVQPLHFAYDAERGEALTHLARPNPLWPALEANPVVLLSVVDDYTFIPGPWQARRTRRPSTARRRASTRPSNSAAPPTSWTIRRRRPIC